MTQLCQQLLCSHNGPSVGDQRRSSVGDQKKKKKKKKEEGRNCNSLQIAPLEL